MLRGSSGSTPFTLSRTSWAATLLSLSSRKPTKMIETPSDDTDRSSSMPLMVLTASSILSEISVSICSGDAPGWTVVTTTVGKSTFGKRSTPRRVKENAPTTVSDRMRTVAKTGRRTEIAASHCMGTPTQASDFRTDGEHRRGTVHSETATPSASCATFFVATRSPAMTPLVISIRPPTVWPSVTIRSWVR